MKKDYRLTVNMDRELYELLERYSGVLGTSMSELCYSLLCHSLFSARDRLKPLVELVESLDEALDSGDVKRAGVLLAELEALTSNKTGVENE